MILRSATLIWIRIILENMGLSLDDVMIFDACPLLDDQSLEDMDSATRRRAMTEAYDLTWKMLGLLRPNIIIACHCNPRKYLWDGITHIAREKLGSTVGGAERGEVKKIEINGHDVHVVQAYHPSRKTVEMKASLEKILTRVYAPCAAWKGDHLIGPRDLVDAMDILTNAVLGCTIASERSTPYLIHCPKLKKGIAVH
jgi:hypothetical protein